MTPLKHSNFSIWRSSLIVVFCFVYSKNLKLYDITPKLSLFKSSVSKISSYITIKASTQAILVILLLTLKFCLSAVINFWKTPSKGTFKTQKFLSQISVAVFLSSQTFVFAVHSNFRKTYDSINFN